MTSNKINKLFRYLAWFGREGDEFQLPRNVLLYRAAETVEQFPKPRYCNDTGKTGTYFSANSPYLAETMCQEYNQNLFVSVYKVVKPIELFIGKYSYRKTWRSYDERFNIPHIDPDVSAIYASDCESAYAEVFLTSQELDNIRFVRSYTMTVDKAIEKWGVRKRF